MLAATRSVRPTCQPCREDVGEDGVIALELPMRPYSEILHAFLGWSEGLMLFAGDGRPALLEMLAVLEDKVQALVDQVAALSGDLLLAPDNLDGQYISPRVFREHFAGSYRRTVEAAHRYGKPLVVHVGGPIRRILPLLAEAGVDGVEGIAGPPQSDATLAEARQLAGPGITLWGGIPQDLLQDIHAQEAFEAGVAEALRQAAGDSRMILGVADRVPVDAEFARLQALPGLALTAKVHSNGNPLECTFNICSLRPRDQAAATLSSRPERQRRKVLVSSAKIEARRINGSITIQSRTASGTVSNTTAKNGTYITSSNSAKDAPTAYCIQRFPKMPMRYTG